MSESIVVEVRRNGVVEAVHRVHAVAVRSGEVVATAGDPSVTCFMRSSSKPLQALPLVRARNDLPDDELTIACASHNDTVEQDKKALELARARYETGIDDRISVVEAESTLQTVQSQAINLGVARAQFEHAIAVLVGANASQFSIPVKPLLTNAPAIPVGMPSVLLERRPDIAAAERADRIRSEV